MRVTTCLFVIILGCATTAPAADAPPSQPTDQVRRDMLVTTPWLAAHLEQPDLVIVHAGKTRSGYEKAHIPGARFLAWSEVAKDREGVLNELPPIEELTASLQRLGIDERSRIILYDEEQGISAARAYVVLDYLGLGGRAALLDGQLAKWRSEGRPTSAQVPTVAPSDWKPRDPRPELIVDLNEMKQLIQRAGATGTPAVPVIDSRSAAEFSGEKAGEQVPRAGHIPGAVSVPSSTNYRSPQLPELLAPSELHASYSKAGVKPGGPVVVYCRSGASASLGYFVSKYLGYEPRLYDGSFSQWSAQPDTPVACEAATTQPVSSRAAK